MSIPTIKIGKEVIPTIGFGAMGIAAAYTTSTSMGNIEESLKTLKLAYDLGVTHWDTSDIYGNARMHQSEEIIAQAFKQLEIPREKIFLASKFGFVRKPDGTRYFDGRPEYVLEAFGKTTAALQTNYLDLYYLHRVTDTPIEETVRAMDSLRQQGKVKFLGLSECSAETLRKANKVAKIDFLQIEYSLFETGIERNGIVDACKELDVVLVPYSPLGRGFLTGTIKSRADLDSNDFRMSDPRFSEENFPKNLELVDHIAQLAKKKGCTTAQLALAWVLHQNKDGLQITTIPGTTRQDRLKENAGAAQVSLTDDELVDIRKMLDSLPVAGERYSPAGMQMVGK